MDGQVKSNDIVADDSTRRRLLVQRHPCNISCWHAIYTQTHTLIHRQTRLLATKVISKYRSNDLWLGQTMANSTHIQQESNAKKVRFGSSGQNRCSFIRLF